MTMAPSGRQPLVQERTHLGPRAVQARLLGGQGDAEARGDLRPRMALDVAEHIDRPVAIVEVADGAL